MATPARTPYQRRHTPSYTKRQEYEAIRSTMKNERTYYEEHWRDLGEFIKTRRTRFFVQDRKKQDHRSRSIIDSTASFAARTLQSGMHAGITSPARPWMRLTTPDPDLAEYGPVKEWLHSVTQRMLTLFLRSNLYNALPIVYGDMGVFATAAFAVFEDAEDTMRCYAYPIGSYWLACSDRQVVDTLMREYLLTVRQIVQAFGWDRQTNTIDWSNISQTVKDLWDKGNEETLVEVCWIVKPNNYRNDNYMGARYLPYSSCVYEAGVDKDDLYLDESGYREFPVLAPRWDLTGEDVYGTDSPGMICLGDVKQLQTMQRRKGQAIELQINPSVQAPTHLQNKVVSLLPGGITWVDAREGQQGIRPIRDVNPNIADMTNDINDTRYMIRRAFYEDLFLMMAQTDRREITAREIDERHEEKLLALGPVLERTNDELLDPLIDRAYGIMEANQMLPDPPQELRGLKLKVEYLSIMAQAQKMVGASSLNRFLGTVVPLAPTFPELRHKVDIFQVVDDASDILGINPKIVLPDDVATQALEQERAAQRAAMQAQAMESVSQSAANLAGADMSGENALTAITGGATPAGLPA